MRPDELITKKDLDNFKEELISLLKPITENQQLTRQKWLRSKDVLKMLKISPGTLQNMRDTGTIAYTKVGKTIFYNAEDIGKVFSGGEKKRPARRK